MYSMRGNSFQNIQQIINYIFKMAASVGLMEVRKRAKIMNRYNQAAHLNQDTNGKVTSSY